MKHCLLALATACGLIAAAPNVVRADGFYVYPGVNVRVYHGDDDRDYWAWRRHEWRERHWREHEMHERWREHHEYPYRWHDDD